MRTLTSTVLIVLIAACASESQSRPATRTAGSGVGGDEICREEKPTGTMFTHKVCRTPDQMQDDRQAADDLIHRRTPTRR
jgi:hypothetical protein